ncbi:restriction endonuclease [Peptoniphilus harei]|uniref:restriction endonuclease n=1 Tax=Peptoniphilus harei TaxID=54005 RepID=UPI00254A8326|nr:restriction endonuclease [Peptoniphilus harei]MDK7354522.1 restriction endonuclease [Peptoniphilus harei]MDK7369849.1 restriction endonuclease [Peptoniphilus harei]
MEKKYWLHRISHHSEVSYDLLKKGYLTIAWSLFLDHPDKLIETIKDKDSDLDFKNYTDRYDVRTRSRWALWNFGQMKVGDTVLVPMYGGKFGVYRILEEIQPISNMKINKFTASNKEEFEIKDSYLVNNTINEPVDLGFFIKVESILKYEDPKPRNFAESKLISRMRNRQTNSDISDLANEVESAIVAKKPHDVYDIFIEEIKNKFIKDNIFGEYTPDQIEMLVDQYFKKMGADDVKILAKNEPGKPKGSDADVEATFTDLKTTYYVQVKKHTGETGMEGLNQIKDYIDNINSNPDDEDEVDIAWLLTTGFFADEVKQKAKEYKDKGEANIRLVDGREFVEMIFNAGIELLDLKTFN